MPRFSLIQFMDFIIKVLEIQLEDCALKEDSNKLGVTLVKILCGTQSRQNADGCVHHIPNTQLHKIL